MIFFTEYPSNKVMIDLFFFLTKISLESKWVFPNPFKMISLLDQLSINPEIILMDEPCSALDPIATAKIEELIDSLKTSFTIVIVTHSMSQAARVSQRTGFFHLGKLIEMGETEKIFKNPNNTMTQDYITGRFG